MGVAAAGGYVGFPLPSLYPNNKKNNNSKLLVLVSWKYKYNIPKAKAASCSSEDYSNNTQLASSSSNHFHSLVDDDEQQDKKERSSSTEVKKEIQLCYDLIRTLGRGVVYLGSARMGPGHEHYIQTQHLSTQGLDQASWMLPLEALFKLECPLVDSRSLKRLTNGHLPIFILIFLPTLTLLAECVCRFFSARKHGLVDAVVRTSDQDKTAVIALPGGIGTLDEAFEILALIQLERIGSSLPVPFILMNYDSFYTKLLEFLGVCENWGTVSKGEVSSLWKVCNNNSEALAYLAEFYDLDHANQQ